MQQQLFKTMHPKPEIMRTRHSSGLNDGNIYYKHTLSIFQNAFTFTPDLAQSIQAKLPKGFFLISENPGDLQKIREEVKNSMPKLNTFQGKSKIIGEKKAQKKIQAQKKLKNIALLKKPKIKDSVKPSQNDKLQKIKKESVLKKKTSIKAPEQKHPNRDEMPEIEHKQEEFQMNQNKSEKNLVKNREKPKSKQKQKQKKDQKEKQKEKDKQPKEIKKNKQIFKQTQKQQPSPQQKPPAVQIPNLQQIRNNPNQFMMSNVVDIDSEEQYVPDYSIPNLQSGLPRYSPSLAEIPPTGSIQTNNLRFLFGLPYGIPTIQNIPKLNQKQKNFCYNILHKLKNHKYSQGFKVPVDPQGQGVPDYHMTVYNPMDLHTIYKKVKNDKYRQISQFHSDINRIFLNSYKYNLRGTYYFKAAVQFEDYYHFLLKEAEEKPEQYAKQLTSKVIRVKKTSDVGQLDYTQNTPLKHKKKKNEWKPNLSKSQFMGKDKASKIKGIFPDFTSNLQSMLSSVNNEFLMDNTNPISAQNLLDKKNKLKKSKSSAWIEQDFSSVVFHRIQANNPQIPISNIHKKDDSLDGDEEYENPFKKWPKKKKNEKQPIIKKDIFLKQQSKVEKKMEIQSESKYIMNEEIPKQIPKIQPKTTIFQSKGKILGMQSTKSQNLEMIPQIQKKASIYKQLPKDWKQIKVQKKYKSKGKINDDYNDDDNSRQSSEMEVEENQKQTKKGYKNGDDIGNMGMEIFFNDKIEEEYNNANDDLISQFFVKKEEKMVQNVPKYQQTKVEKQVYGDKNISSTLVNHYKAAESEQKDKTKQLSFNQHPNSDIIVNTMVLADTKETKSSTKNQSSPNYEQLITVNSLNTHPPLVLAALNNFDVIIEQPSSTAPTISLPPSYFKTKTINKSKISKNKNLDEQYQCSSDDDEEYIQPKYRKRADKKKKDKSKEYMIRENSNSMETGNIQPKRRGRHPKKLGLITGLDRENNTTLVQKSSQIQQRNAAPAQISSLRHNPSQISIHNEQNNPILPSTQPIAHSQESLQHSYDNIKYTAQPPITHPSNIFIDKSSSENEEEQGINFLDQI